MAQHSIDRDSPAYAPDKLPRKDEVGIPAYFALDIRAGRVTAVDEFPEARKPSYKIRVDFGPAVGELQSSAQITNYSVEDLLGRMVIGAINLGTKRIAGYASEFLILGALDPDGTVRLIAVEDGVQPGAPIA